jgi:hypothetical protein
MSDPYIAIRERIGCVLDAITYKDWYLQWFFEPGNAYLQWRFSAPDYSGQQAAGLRWWTTRKYNISHHMTEGELVQTAFMAALQAEEHEAREAFRYMDKAPFNPHISVAALLSVCDQLEVRP